MSFSYSHAQSVLITLNLQRIDCALRSSLGVSNTAQVPPNVVTAPHVATSKPEADPEAILSAEDFVDWKDIEKHLADPDLEVFDRTPDENESEPQTVEKETGSQTPATSSAPPEATATAAHDEL